MSDTPSLSSIVWSRPLWERAEDSGAVVPRSARYLAESWRVVPGRVRSRLEVRAKAIEEFGPPVGPFVLGRVDKEP